jgi:hypothetical protein
MGSFSYLTVADYPIFEIKNGYFEEIINLIFLPEDFVEEKRHYASRNIIIWGNSYETEKRKFVFKGFKQTAKVCKQRLEIYGASTKSAKKDFQLAKKIAKKEGNYDFPINKVTYEQYIDQISIILKNKERGYDELFTNLKDSLLAGQLGIDGQTIQGHIFSILNTLPEDAIIEYDLSDVISGGWVKEQEVKQISIEKIIVLTEGKTDVEFISAGLTKLYPHLSPYYHFINFDEYKVESNASALVKLVIALAASNIKHPIIVLFDNDTTGIMEMKKLNSINLSNNFKILKYPDIQMANKYPTIGPTGIKKMNVNGLACGIEMYFGQEILTNSTFRLYESLLS